jgi:hypothetical protein
MNVSKKNYSVSECRFLTVGAYDAETAGQNNLGQGDQTFKTKVFQVRNCEAVVLDKWHTIL